MFGRRGLILGVVFSVVSILAFSNLAQADAQQTITIDQPFILIEHGFMANYSWPAKSAGTLECFDVTLSINTNTHSIPVCNTDENKGIFYSPLLRPTTSITDAYSYPAVVGNVIKVYNSSDNSITTPSFTIEDMDQSFPSPWKQKKNVISPFADCANYGNDADSDGICDDWETATGLSINFPNSNVPYTYPCDYGGCPSKTVKDIYVEVDYMKGHKPNVLAIRDVIDGFKNNLGINLHVQIDDSSCIGGEEMQDVEDLRTPGSKRKPGSDQVKRQCFGTEAERGPYGASWWTSGYKNKGQAFHYSIFAHQLYNKPGISGVSETPGNDFVVSLFEETAGVGSKDQQSGTFMHELGHNFDLKHAGAVDLPTCMPQLPSIMSYSLQYADLDTSRAFDFSHKSLGTLNRDSLNETAGVPSYAPHSEVNIVFGGANGLVVHPLSKTGGTPIDWDHSGGTSGIVSADITFIGYNGTVVCTQNQSVTMTGSDEVTTLGGNMDPSTSSNWSDGRGGAPGKGTIDKVMAWQIDIFKLESYAECEFNNDCLSISAVEIDEGGAVVWKNNESETRWLRIFDSVDGTIIADYTIPCDESRPCLAASSAVGHQISPT